MSEELLFEGKVLRIRDEEDLKDGWVEIHGVRVRVNLSLVPEVQVGDRVLVQGRTALSRIENSV